MLSIFDKYPEFLRTRLHPQRATASFRKEFHKFVLCKFAMIFPEFELQHPPPTGPHPFLRAFAQRKKSAMTFLEQKKPLPDKWQMDDLKALVLEKLILESQDLGTLNKLWEMSKMWQMEIPKALAEEVVARGIFKALPFSEFSDRPEIFVKTKLKNGRLVTIKYSCQSCRTTMQSVINKVAAKMEEETHKVRLYSGNASVPGTALAVSFGGCKLIARVL